MSSTQTASTLSQHNQVIRLFEIARNACAALGFYFAYQHYFQQEYLIALHRLILLLVIPLTGLTGLESILFSDATARSKGWAIGNPYQIQSGMNNLAIAITAIMILFFKWDQYAELSILCVTLIFFSLSAINHAISFFKQPHKKIIHLTRLIFSGLMIAAALPIILKII